jgi:triacylglycerol lipase
MPGKHRIYLIPGFFGFANLGELVYFSHVKDYLMARMASLHVPGVVVSVPTAPTGSIRKRAVRLLEIISETSSPEDTIHLIGHSTGGLDARLLVTPSSSLGEGLNSESVASQVRTVISVATPHYGTPLATFFTSFFGQKLLKFLSLFTVTVLRSGRIPGNALAKLVKAVSKLDPRSNKSADTLLDQLIAQLLASFAPDRRSVLGQFLDEIGADQSLIPQLTPEGIDLFNAATADRASVRYASVVTRAKRPTWRTRIASGLSPYSQLTHSLWVFLARQTATLPKAKLPPLSPVQTSSLIRGYGTLPLPEDNDGIVPTLSQVWGELICVAVGDHLDVIGHFDDRHHTPPHIDWMMSGSGFKRANFEKLWDTVVRYMLVP